MLAYGVCIGSRERYEDARRARACATSAASSSRPTTSARSAPPTTRSSTPSPTSRTSRASCCCTRTSRSRAPRSSPRIRTELADPDVAVVGAIGALRPASLRWWQGEGRGRVRDSTGLVDFGGGRHDVDVLDGLCLVLSPWAIAHLRFDESAFDGFHGYDSDICLQARAAGRRVRVTDLPITHHTHGGYGDAAAYARASAAFAAKWRDLLFALAGHPRARAGHLPGLRRRRADRARHPRRRGGRVRPLRQRPDPARRRRPGRARGAVLGRRGRRRPRRLDRARRARVASRCSAATPRWPESSPAAASRSSTADADVAVVVGAFERALDAAEVATRGPRRARTRRPAAGRVPQLRRRRGRRRPDRLGPARPGRPAHAADAGRRPRAAASAARSPPSRRRSPPARRTTRPSCGAPAATTGRRCAWAPTPRTSCSCRGRAA